MDKLLEHFGTQTALANFLNIKTGHVYYWIQNGIEKKTDGLFNRRLLCPEFFNQ